MSEKLTPRHEAKSENLDLSGEIKRNLENLSKAALEAESQKAELHELQDAVKQEAISGQEITVGEREVPKSHTSHATPKELKADAYKRSLSRVQSRLNVVDRGFSKIAHQPVIDSASNVMSKTVARPSGILGGGICALLGSSFLLYLTKRYGFEYNFFVYFLLLAIGFVLGMTAELVIRAILKRKR
jgi:hypothetical protein